MFSERSPFARRIRVLLKRLDIHYKETILDIVGAPLPDELYRWNPIGTVPILVMDEKMALSDSAAIIDYFHSKKGIWSHDELKALKERRASVQAEGLMTSSVAYFVETNLRKLPKDEWWQDHTASIERVLRYFQNLIKTEKDILVENGGLTQPAWDFAIGLQYVILRMPDFKWKEFCPLGEEILNLALQSKFFVETIPPPPVK